MSSFPQTFKSTVSHWQATNRGLDTLYNHGREAPLPDEEVDYVIIGAGMTGASLAYALTRPGVCSPGSKIVVLEAKDVASGASGRNGGHIAPWSFANFYRLLRPLREGGGGLTEEEALDVLQLERDNLQYVGETVKTEGWGCDFWKGEKIEVCVSEKETAFMREAYAAWIEALGRSEKYRESKPDWTWIDDPVKAEEISRIKDMKSLSRGPAGSIHPHKLATHFLRSALDTGMVRLFSWAPVKAFTERKIADGCESDGLGGGGGGWDVETVDRGTIRAKRVVVCTNAHTRHLFPGEAIDKHLTPYQAQAANITPPPTYSGPTALNHTIVAERGPYLIQTPHAGFVMGIGEDTSIGLGLAEKRDIYEVVDDSYVKPELREWLGTYCKENFMNWGEESPGEGAMRVWSGIICASRDMLPLVGEVPGREGLSVAVGFHGHGMARICQTTRCLAQILTTGKWDERLPRSFEITKERLERGQTAPPFITDRERPGEAAKGKGWVERVFGRRGDGGGEVRSVIR